MKPHRGSATAARDYVEADRCRADDYYLAEGTGVAERYAAAPETGVERLAPLTGDRYEAWVAGMDPDTGEPRGRVRHDERAVRFQEVIVNGPKSWSLAAELHPDIAAAYDAAQDAAAQQVIGWLAQHATTRVGGRGKQVQVPVERLEAVTVRHYTSRAGDPHRHLHLQVNARVFADGQWRALHTVGVRDSLSAVNGIGHAAMMTDPAFRRALAGHGLTLDPDTGEATQLAPFVGAFSRRAAQIEANLNRYEAEWRVTHPGEHSGPGLWRAWDARAWADGRPDKVMPEPGEDLNRRWVNHLCTLGYRDPAGPVHLTPAPVGRLDRDAAVEVVLARLGAAGSAWNAAQVRGEVEQLLARANIVTDPAVRGELAEDLTARALARCVSLLDRPGVPEHIRALTSRPVLAVEDDIVARLAARGARPGHDHVTPVPGGGDGHELDVAQARAVAVLAGDRPLVVIEGAAGAGKTATLAAAREVLAAQGRTLLVVTPTLKAAQVARTETGATTGSAAWLAHQHGWRWNQHGSWTRLHVGDLDPTTGREYTGPSPRAVLRRGDVVLVDEAGMLDQDTARALLTIADEQHARIAFVGDRHQLPAVGRGGVLDLAHRWADPDGYLTLDRTHRFTRPIMVGDGVRWTPDEQYAELAAAMRTTTDPAAVFDTLYARGLVHIHPDTAGQQQAIADDVLAAHRTGARVAVVADTREQVAVLNAAVRDRLVAAGIVDDQHTTTTTGTGERIGVGDVVATRRNDRDLGVANRDTWTVLGIDRHGQLTVTGERGQRTLPAGYVRGQVELAYATTVHGAQGDTTDSAHLVLGEHTSAASAYVGMTRGRQANTAHLLAEDLDTAREQWVVAFARDRADLGPAHARQLAEQEAARYATGRPLDQVLAELRAQWRVEADAAERLDRAVPTRDQLVELVALRCEHADRLEPLTDRYEQAARAAGVAAARAGRSAAVLTAQTDQLRQRLQADWDADYGAAVEQAGIVRAGPGRLGLHLVRVNRATEQLAAWSLAWQPILPDMPTSTDRIAYYAERYHSPADLHDAFERYARTQVEQAHPEHQPIMEAAATAKTERDDAAGQLYDTRRTLTRELDRYGHLTHITNPEDRVEQLDHAIAADRDQLASARSGIGRLAAEPEIRRQPAGFLDAEHDSWQSDRDSDRQVAKLTAAARAVEAEALTRTQMSHAVEYHAPQRDHGPSIGR